MKQYNEYKDSGIEWLGQIPAHWILKDLQLLAENKEYAFTDGPFGSDLKNEEYVAEGIPLIQLNNIKPGSHNLDKLKFITEEKSNQLVKHQAMPGDIVIAKMAEPVARATIVADDFDLYNIVADCIKFSPNSKMVNSDFLVYAMNSGYVKSQAEVRATGTTRLRISLGVCKKLKICLPELTEQNKIAHFLNHQTQVIDALVAKKKALIEKLQLQRHAIINEAVTKGLHPDAPMKDSGIEWLGEIPAHWEVVKLKYLVDKVGSGVTPRGGSTVYTEEGVYLLRSQNIYSDGLRLENCVRIPEVIHEKMKGSQVQYGDVLLNITGASIGRVFYWNKKSIEANVNQHVCIIRVNDRVIFQYIQGFLAAEIGQLQIFSGQDGTSREGLNFEELKNFVVVLPSIQEQTEIVSFIDQQTQRIDQLIAKSQKSIEKLKTYRQTIISEAVTGKVDVSGWTG